MPVAPCLCVSVSSSVAWDDNTYLTGLGCGLCGVTYVQEPSAERRLVQRHSLAPVGLVPDRCVPQAPCTSLSHGVCCWNIEVSEPDFSGALTFAFHFLNLSLLPLSPNYITEVGRLERSLLLEAPACECQRGQDGWAGEDKFGGPNVGQSDCKGRHPSFPLSQIQHCFPEKHFQNWKIHKWSGKDENTCTL